MMKTISISKTKISEEVIIETTNCIKSGGVAVIPFDTTYGLAGDIANPDAVQKIYAIKHRSLDKKLSIVFDSIDEIKKWTMMTAWQENILKKNLPGQFTFILTSNEDYPLKTETVGVRIPDNPFIEKLSEKLEIPYSATSANISGLPACYSYEEFMYEIKGHSIYPDLFIDAGKLPYIEPSTVVDITENKIKILRQGEMTPKE